MKKIFSYWGFRVICILLFCLYLCPSRTSAQAIEAGYGKGEVLKFDNWLNKEGALKQQDAQSFWLGYIYQTHADEDLRTSLLAFAEKEGVDALHDRLRAVDPESAEAIHKNNVKRVVRALEIYEHTGIPKSEFDRRSRVNDSPYDAFVVGLHYPNREVLYERINRRVDIMLDDGLLEETKQLKDEGVFEVNLTAAQAIGYKELLGYLAGVETLSEATENLKTATRRYAKRQLTWFSAKPYVVWVEMEKDGVLRSLDDICDEIVSRFQNREGSV